MPIKTQTIAKAYLRGVWDSVKGVLLIFIVIRDTYFGNSAKEKNDSPKVAESEADESSSSSTNTTQTTHTTPHRHRSASKRNQLTKREQNKLKEYGFYNLFIFVVKQAQKRLAAYWP